VDSLEALSPESSLESSLEQSSSHFAASTSIGAYNAVLKPKTCKCKINNSFSKLFRRLKFKVHLPRTLKTMLIAS